jgi:hypothetical protein
VSAPDDPPVLDLDPCPELVAEPESVSGAKRLEVFQDLRRWLVVVGHAEIEGHLEHPADGLRGDPPDRRD